MAQPCIPCIAHNFFSLLRKLIDRWNRLYIQDHSRGRGLTTTGQPTVSFLPLNKKSLIFKAFLQIP